MLGVNFQWDAVESEFGEQTIHLISMFFAFRKRRKELLAYLLDDDGFVSCVGVMINRRIYDPRRWHKRSSSSGIVMDWLQTSGELQDRQVLLIHQLVLIC
jgi:hypothetical protein